MPVLKRFLTKQVSPNECSCRASSSAAQAVIPLLSWGVRPNSTTYLQKPAYSNEPVGCPNKTVACSNASAAISCFTPAPADRLHYVHGLPEGGLDIYGA